MKSLLTAFVVLGLGTTVAFADDDPAPTETEEAANPCSAEAPTDCSALEGEEKTTCEEAAKATDQPEEKKGGKQMKKSDDGNMEKFVDEDQG